MTQPTNTYSSYDAVGNREDLADFISMISPTATPFQSGIRTVSATSTKHESQTDALAAASGTNAVIEGDDAVTDASTATTRIFNYTQILDKVARVTGTQRAMDSAGRADEMDYQILKRTKEIKRDLETSLLANNAQVAGNDTTAREMGGIESWIATNDDFGAGAGASPTGDGSDARTDGTQRAFTESQLKTVIASCFDNGGEPDTIMVGSFNKQALSAFSGGATRNIDATGKTLVNAIDIYVSDFGTMKVVPNRFQRSRSALVLDMDLWAKADLRPMFRHDLAKSGDTDRVQLIMETTLESKNEAGSGGVFDLTTS
jgi:hypothetical protein